MSLAAAAPASMPVRTFHLQKILNWLFALFVFCGAISFIEPSPYDFVSLVVIPLWFFAGFKVHRSFVLFGCLMIVYNIAGFISLVPYWSEPDPVMFMLQSFYLLVTALFFALFFGERTSERIELCLKAFTASNLFAALCAVAGYLDIAGSSALFMNYDRAAGPFKDPNVLGSFLIAGALYCMQLLMLGRTRWRLFTAATLLVLCTGTFLTFSRGSWGAFALATSHAATTDGSAVSWTRTSGLVPWASQSDGTYTITATVTDRVGNTFTGTKPPGETELEIDHIAGYFHYLSHPWEMDTDLQVAFWTANIVGVVSAITMTAGMTPTINASSPTSATGIATSPIPKSVHPNPDAYSLKTR